MIFSIQQYFKCKSRKVLINNILVFSFYAIPIYRILLIKPKF